MPTRNCVGSILGTAVGDAIGLPYEGLSRRRGVKLLGPPERHRFLFGRGMASDDTEHTCLVAQALIATAGEPDRFSRDFAKRLRWWLLSLPAGIGYATLRAIFRLWLGFSPSRSGVFSAGNGPAMRAAILGAAIAGQEELCRLVEASTVVTHRDPKALHGALAVATAAQMAAESGSPAPAEFLARLKLYLNGEGEELLARVERAIQSLAAGESTQLFAESLGQGRGVSGYVLACVPVVIHAWLAQPLGCRAAVFSVDECGGDTHSIAAMVGGVVGAAVGKEGIPEEWLGGVCEWPGTVAWMERLAEQLEEVLQSREPAAPLTLPYWKVLPRNLLFLLVVFAHVGRRLLPPY